MNLSKGYVLFVVSSNFDFTPLNAVWIHCFPVLLDVLYV